MNKLTMIFVLIFSIGINSTFGSPSGNTIERSSSSRIIGGQIANPGQFSYVAALQTPAFVQFCGSSIISNRWLITAGHCVNTRQPANVIARVGSTTFNKGGVAHQIAQIRVHPQFLEQTRGNDLSLLQTILPIVFDWQTKSIALSTFDLGVSQGVIAGWGSLFSGGQQSIALQFINSQTILNHDCLTQHAASGFAGLIQESNVCSMAGPGVGICTGDSGNGLAVENQLIGVASWASGCGTGVPDVFTRISSHRDWIIQVTAE